MKNPIKTNLWLMLLAAFTVGTTIMGLEMLASRFLNPYFGGTIFTWAALISIVLLAMMLGYFAGGYSVDKVKFPYVLETMIGLAGLYFLCLPYFVDGVLEWVVTEIENVKAGALIGAFLITGPPVALLSTFTPIAIGRTLEDLEHTGRISGTIFAVSTMGNIFGTLVTSFYLIPNYGTRNLTQSLALLLLLAIGLCLLARRRHKAKAAAMLIMGASMIPLMSLPLSEVKADTAFKIQAAYPEGPVFIDGDLYYAEMTRNRIMKVKWDNPTKQSRLPTKQPRLLFYEKGCGPTALAPYGKDKIVILCHLSDRLMITDRRGKALKTIRWAEGSIEIFHPNDCIADQNGGVYITAPGHFDKNSQPMGRLFYLNKEGEVRELAKGLTYPNGIAIYNGELYVAEHLAGRIIKFPIQAPGKLGAHRVVVKTPKPALDNQYTNSITGPDGIEIDKDGTIYVAHYGAGEVLVYNKQATLQKALSARPQFVTNLTLIQDSLIITGASTLSTVLQEGLVYFQAR